MRLNLCDFDFFADERNFRLTKSWPSQRRLCYHAVGQWKIEQGNRHFFMRSRNVFAITLLESRKLRTSRHLESAVLWAPTLQLAQQLAKKQDRLLFVLHVSGDFEQSNFT